MNALKTLALTLAVLFAVALTVRADEKKADTKEVTVKGTFVCTKCALQETADCGNAIQVKDGDKTVTYYLKDDAKAAPYHGKFCTKKGVTGSVTGVVSEDGGKKYITPSKDGVKID
jgi:uncharacterized protein DUF6370